MSFTPPTGPNEGMSQDGHVRAGREYANRNWLLWVALAAILFILWRRFKK